MTERQLQILRLAAEGFNSKQIGAKLNITFRTVEEHKRAMFQKTGAINIANLIYIVMKEKIIS